MSEPIREEIREEILFRIKNEGLNVPNAAEQYGINRRTIYSWLSVAGITNPSSQKIREQQKEIDNLYTIIGKLSTELNRLKKGQSWK